MALMDVVQQQTTQTVSPGGNNDVPPEQTGGDAEQETAPSQPSGATIPIDDPVVMLLSTAVAGILLADALLLYLVLVR